jgi:GH25 family lysozyme M1 (1,4-beta-N-acetylmuramidase)
VNSIDPSLDVVFYHAPCPELSFENNTVTKSNWDEHPVGSQATSIEGCVVNNELPVTDSPTVTGEASPPFLIVDVYAGDVKGKPAWDVLTNTPKYYGAIIKATEGNYYNGGDWFRKNWPAVKDAGKDRYGSTWFRGAYLFLKFNLDGDTQADYYLNAIDTAGGWDQGDIIPIIDVELGNDGSKDPSKRNSNHDASAQQIIDCTTACADRLRSQTGRNIMLYGRGAMRDKGINSRMGCDIVWNPSYTATMVLNGLQAWDLSDIALWQYCGDGDAAIDEAKLPRFIPDFGAVDISVYIDGGNKPTLDTLLTRLRIGTV